MATENQQPPGLDALRRLKTLEPPQWLAPSPELSREAREASHYLFSSLKSFAPKSPFEKLLVEGFDAEQIWQQIDVQSQPLMSSLRRDVRRLEKNPEEILKVFGEKKVAKRSVDEVEDEEDGDDDVDFEDFDEGMEDFDEDGDDDEESEDEEEEEEDGKGGIEDKFFKLDELDEFLEQDEEREYGLKPTQEEKKKKKRAEESDDEEDEEEDFELEVLALDGDGSEDGKEMLPRYEDFYGRKKKKDVKRKSGLIDGSEDSDTGDEQENRKASKTKKNVNLSTHEKEHVKPQSEIKQMENENMDTKSLTMQGENKVNLSTYEKEHLKLQSKIKQMENENMDVKSWAMQGEVTADKRPINSLLAANLDFDHTMKPAPVITEKVTESIEDLIKKRILEGRFDDAQKIQSLSSKAPKERKELDENKSKKGLAEIYEDDYAQKINPDSAPLTFSDERKKEATLLFKTLSMKLDALSHFHFSPKPVIDDMSIRVNVPALAMEEIAPVAVSDAAMLAPEEVFTGKGDIKEDAELSQAERKRRRANKKRKFKAVYANKVVKKARESTSLDAKDTAR